MSKCFHLFFFAFWKNRCHVLRAKMEDYIERLRVKIDANAVLAKNGECRLWEGGLTSNRRYGVVCFKDPKTQKWIKRHVHRVSYMVFVRDFSIPSYLDASHLCHNNLCINSSHISLEPHHINNNRSGCRSSQTCHEHGPYPACRLELYGRL